MPTFWRTWWLGDTSGGLVVLPLMLAWARDPAAAWRRSGTWEGALLLATVGALGVIAVSTDEPVTYMVFPALIWAAFRFGPPGATLAIAIAAGVAIGVTANEVGPFFKQPIDHRTLSTQAYIAVAALTTLFLSAVVSERERSAAELAEARLHEGERAMEERHRIARDLHDSVSQALFSTGLHTRTRSEGAQAGAPEPVQPAGASTERDRRADKGRAERDARARSSSWVVTPSRTGSSPPWPSTPRGSAAGMGWRSTSTGPTAPGALAPRRGPALRDRARGLANVLKHAGARSGVGSRRESSGPRARRDRATTAAASTRPQTTPVHFGIESMRSRAAEIGGLLTITSAPGRGTVVRVEAPAEAGGVSDGN